MSDINDSPLSWGDVAPLAPNLPDGGPFADQAPLSVLSVREAIDAGDWDGAVRAICREAVGYLTEPYVDSFALMGVVPLEANGAGWRQGRTDLTQYERTRELAQSRTQTVFSPPAHHAVRMRGSYVVGQGIPMPSAVDSDVQAVIEDFWEDPDNAELTTFLGQQETDASLQVNGELFLAFFTAEDDGHVKVRSVDALDVVDVVTSPQDRKRALYYRVRLHNDAYDFATGTSAPVPAVAPQNDGGIEKYVYFPAWTNTDPERDPYKGKATPLADGGAIMGHWALNRLGLRGIPDSASAGPWVSQHKKFMGERAILQAAAAKIAFIKTVKGGPGQVNASAALEQTSLSASISGLESNPAWAPGSTYVHNDGIDMEQMKFDTMAGNATQDGEMLAQMFSTAFGFPTYYTLMSTQSTRLATAVAMELPVLKLMLGGQQMWKDMLRAVLDFALLQAALHKRLKVPLRKAHGRQMIDWKHAPLAPDDDTPSPDTSTATTQDPVREMEPQEIEATAAHIQERQKPTAQKADAQKQRGSYTIDLPPILERDTQALITAIVDAGKAGYITPEQAAYQVMVTLGFGEVTDEMDKWRTYVETHADVIDKHAEEAAQLAQQQIAVKGGAPASGPKPKTPATTAGAGVPSKGMSA